MKPRSHPVAYPAIVSASIDRERILLHHDPVLERPGLGFVGVADEVVRPHGLLRDRLPLHPGRERRAAAAHELRVGDLADRARRPERVRASERLVPAVRPVVVDRARVHDADAPQQPQAGRGRRRPTSGARKRPPDRSAARTPPRARRRPSRLRTWARGRVTERVVLRAARALHQDRRGALAHARDRGCAPRTRRRRPRPRSAGRRSRSSSAHRASPSSRHARSSQTCTTVVGRGSTLNIA